MKWFIKNSLELILKNVKIKKKISINLKKLFNEKKFFCLKKIKKENANIKNLIFR